MKKDIPNHKLVDAAMAIVPRTNPIEGEEELWDVHFLNLKEESIQNVLISSYGFGTIDEKEVKTTKLRHFFEEVGGMQWIKIEPISTRVFDLTNEFWVSYQYNGYMYDKKYIFVRGSISDMNFTTIPFLNKSGVMIR